MTSGLACFMFNENSIADFYLRHCCWVVSFFFFLILMCFKIFRRKETWEHISGMGYVMKYIV